MSNTKVEYNAKRYTRVKKAGLNANGDLVVVTKAKKDSKAKAYVVRIQQNKKGNWVNKKVMKRKNVKDIYFNPQTGIAEYFILKNGNKVSCTTGEKIS